MCSSPKSNGTVRKSRLKGVFEDMGPSVRANFVAKANAAQERRSDLKNAAARRKQKAALKGISKKALNKKRPPANENVLLSFLHRMGYSV